MSELDEYPKLQRALAVIALRMGLKVTAAPDDVVRAVVRMADDNTGLRQALAEAREVLRNREAELAEFEQAHRWIPVRERMPEDGAAVLAYGHRRGDARLRVVERWGSDWVCIASGAVVADYVTHWMPLPKGPEGQRDEA